MTFYTAARGEVVGAPVRVTTDTGGATVLALREVLPESGEPGKPDQLAELGEPGVEYQVCVREPELSRHVLEQIRLGDRLLVLGTLQMHAVTGPLEDSLSAARVSLDAVVIGLDVSPDNSGLPAGPEETKSRTRRYGAI